jgi:hypothetical protein
LAVYARGTAGSAFHHSCASRAYHRAIPGAWG